MSVDATGFDDRDVESAAMARPVDPARLSRLALPLAVVIAMAILIVPTLIDGSFGTIGPDNDDLMRLIQVRDLMAGQSWFDLHQYRLGSEGTLMHWSRLVDLPLVGLISLFDVFVSADLAERLAVGLWPPLCVILVLFGVLWGAKNLGLEFQSPASGTAGANQLRWIGSSAAPWIIAFCTLLTLLQFSRHMRFLPGAIDHHNLQMGLLAIACGFAVDPARRWWSGAVAGTAVALSVAVGVEVYLFAAIMCGWFVLVWLMQPKASADFVTAFGLALSFVAGVVFVGTVAPSDYSLVTCDALSMITVSAAMVGGLGLAGVAMTLSGKSLFGRAAGLAVLGVVCLALLGSQAPQCLANPLSSLSPMMRTLWLDNISEARSIFVMADDWSTFGAYLFGSPLVALAVCVWQIRRGRAAWAHGLFAALLGVAIAMAVYQVRFGAMALLFCIMPLGYWVGQLFAAKNDALPGSDQSRSLAYMGALFLATPMVWAIPGQMLDPAAASSSTSKQVQSSGLSDRDRCANAPMVSTLRTLPPGLVLSDSDMAPGLLSDTPQRALNGNYHRNITGIESSIQAFNLAPEKARSVMHEAGVSYLLFCRDLPSMKAYAKYSPQGLAANLQAGTVPAYLEMLTTSSPAAEGVLYRVR